jgi:hypothetical protein
MGSGLPVRAAAIPEWTCSGWSVGERFHWWDGRTQFGAMLVLLIHNVSGVQQHHRL